MDYGKALRIVRTARELTQRDLAARAEMDPSYVSLIEKGHRVPSMKILETLAAALDVPVYLLVLLASDKEELRGITPSQADLLGNQLLQVVLQGSTPAGQ